MPPSSTVRQYATPSSPGCAVAVRADQSVVWKGTSWIFMGVMRPGGGRCPSEREEDLDEMAGRAEGQDERQGRSSITTPHQKGRASGGGEGRRVVSTSYPRSGTSTVCSNWAQGLPSA